MRPSSARRRTDPRLPESFEDEGVDLVPIRCDRAVGGDLVTFYRAVRPVRPRDRPVVGFAVTTTARKVLGWDCFGHACTALDPGADVRDLIVAQGSGRRHRELGILVGDRDVEGTGLRIPGDQDRTALASVQDRRHVGQSEAAPQARGIGPVARPTVLDEQRSDAPFEQGVVGGGKIAGSRGMREQEPYRDDWGAEGMHGACSDAGPSI